AGTGTHAAATHHLARSRSALTVRQGPPAPGARPFTIARRGDRPADWRTVSIRRRRVGIGRECISTGLERGAVGPSRRERPPAASACARIAHASRAGVDPRAFRRANGIGTDRGAAPGANPAASRSSPHAIRRGVSANGGTAHGLFTEL